MWVPWLLKQDKQCVMLQEEYRTYDDVIYVHVRTYLSRIEIRLKSQSPTLHLLRSVL